MITGILAAAAVLLGALIIITSLLPPTLAIAPARDPAAERARLARRFGLAHRFAGRLLQSRLRPADDNFVELAEISNRYAIAMPAAIANVVALGEPLLEVEELLERMESFTARMRSWRPGRSRGKR